MRRSNHGFSFSIVAFLVLHLELRPIQGFGGVTPTSLRRNRGLPSKPSLLITTSDPPPKGSPTALFAKLWDRLQIEEDPEPFWYLLNCVAGSEIDLLRQCRQKCGDMPDVVKFVVPVEKKTRSHGANRMVTETKVKYLGYVFAKLRLCPPVYEAIQELDLCRSWMGTVNHKGHKKLPPAPVALNEMEVESFGLEEAPDSEDDEDGNTGVIVDTVERDRQDNAVEQDALKVYQGLKVEDMVKVTAKGKYFNEDGIVRRLKDGRILVRFYTYGQMFEDWMGPADVRKLSNVEILKGLSGPSQPITQREFDGPQNYRGGRPSFDDSLGNGRLRQNLMGASRGGGGGPRNRRQDRTERQFRQRYDDEQRRNDRNWNWYQEQQRSRRPNDASEGNRGMIAGSSYNQRRDRGGDWALGNVDSQWGRNSYAPRRDNRNPRNQGRNQSQQRNRFANRQNDAAIRGQDDWSAFVSPSPPKKKQSRDDDDDFFSSLMSELSQDLGPNKENSGSNPLGSDSSDDFFGAFSDSRSGSAGNARRAPKKTPRKSSRDASGDFFANLEAELGAGLSGSDSPSSVGPSDDFFAELEAELAKPKPSRQSRKSANRDAPRDAREQPSTDTDDFFSNLNFDLSPDESTSSFDSDDFFAKLESSSSSTSSGTSQNKGDAFSTSTGLSDDFFAQLESDLTGNTAKCSSSKEARRPPKAKKAATAPNGSDDDFFASLESELGRRTEDDSTAAALDSFFAELGVTSPPPSSPTPWEDVSPVESSSAPRPSPAKTKAPSKPSRKSPPPKASAPPPAPSKAPVSPAGKASADDLQKRTVPQLKDMLRERGLKVSGRKAELIDRLIEAS